MSQWEQLTRRNARAHWKKRSEVLAAAAAGLDGEGAQALPDWFTSQRRAMRHKVRPYLPSVGRSAEPRRRIREPVLVLSQRGSCILNSVVCFQPSLAHSRLISGWVGGVIAVVQVVTGACAATV